VNGTMIPPMCPDCGCSDTSAHLPDCTCIGMRVGTTTTAMSTREVVAATFHELTCPRMHNSSGKCSGIPWADTGECANPGASDFEAADYIMHALKAYGLRDNQRTPSQPSSP